MGPEDRRGCSLVRLLLATLGLFLTKVAGKFNETQIHGGKLGPQHLYKRKKNTEKKNDLKLKLKES